MKWDKAALRDRPTILKGIAKEVSRTFLRACKKVGKEELHVVKNSLVNQFLVTSKKLKLTL